MATIYKPGQTVPTSGQYGTVNVVGTFLGREATCTKGEPFPPLRANTSEYGWVLRDATLHL